MGKASYKDNSFLKSAARCSSLALAAALALALGIGVNGAIFNLGGLSRAEIFPDSIRVLFQGNFQAETADPHQSEEPASELAEREAVNHHTFIRAQRCDLIFAAR